MRALRTLMGLIAFAMLLVAFGDVVLHNRFTLMAPGWFAVLVAVVLGFLLHEFVVARQRTELLDRQAAQLKSASGRLEQSLAAAAAFNARLNQSEARYRALVDAQGDAICRRAPDSRLTYGNDAFFKLFGLDPRRAIGTAFAPELHPTSRAPLFGSFAGLETGRARCATTSMSAPPMAGAGSPGKITRCATPPAGWSRCKASAATSPSARRWKTPSPLPVTRPKLEAAPSRASWRR